MSYLPQTVEELQARYHVRYIPINKDDPDGDYLTFVGSKNKFLRNQEEIWFSKFAVQDIVARAKKELMDQILANFKSQLPQERQDNHDESGNHAPSN